MMAAPRTTNHSESTLPSSSSPRGQGGRGFEPFVQLASWGHGSFTPLAQFTSGGLLLGGGDGGEKGGGAWGVPSGVGAAAGAGAACQLGSGQEESCGNRDRAHSIRTREGSLEIAPAEGKQHQRQQRGKGCGSQLCMHSLTSVDLSIGAAALEVCSSGTLACRVNPKSL